MQSLDSNISLTVDETAGDANGIFDGECTIYRDREKTKTHKAELYSLILDVFAMKLLQGVKYSKNIVLNIHFHYIHNNWWQIELHAPINYNICKHVIIIILNSSFVIFTVLLIYLLEKSALVGQASSFWFLLNSHLVFHWILVNFDCTAIWEVSFKQNQTLDNGKSCVSFCSVSVIASQVHSCILIHTCMAPQGLCVSLGFIMELKLKVL